MENNNNETSNHNKKDLLNSDMFKNIFNEVIGKANTGQILNNSIFNNSPHHFNASVISRFFNLIKDIINITTSNGSSTNKTDLSIENIMKKIKNESLLYQNISNDYSSEIIANHSKINSTNEIITHVINNYNTNDIKTYIAYNNNINSNITHNINNNSINSIITHHINNHSVSSIVTHHINNHSVNENIMHHINNTSTKEIKTNIINKNNNHNFVQNKTKNLVTQKQNNIIINKNNNNYSDDSNISTILGIGLPILITIVLILIYFIKKKIKKPCIKDKKNLDEIKIKNSGSKMFQKKIQNTSSLNILDPNNNSSMSDIRILNMKNDLNSILSKSSVDSMSSSGQRKRYPKKKDKKKVKNVIEQDPVSQEKVKNELNEEIKQYVIDENNKK